MCSSRSLASILWHWCLGVIGRLTPGQSKNSYGTVHSTRPFLFERRDVDSRGRTVSSCVYGQELDNFARRIHNSPQLLFLKPVSPTPAASIASCSTAIGASELSTYHWSYIPTIIRPRFPAQSAFRPSSSHGPSCANLLQPL